MIEGRAQMNKLRAKGAAATRERVIGDAHASCGSSLQKIFGRERTKAVEGSLWERTDVQQSRARTSTRLPGDDDA